MTWFTLGMEAILTLLCLVPAPAGGRWMGLARLPVGHSTLRATLVALSPVRVLTALDRILGH